MPEATRLLSLAEAGAKKQAKLSKSLKQVGRYPPGTEYELVTACATILLGLTNALRYVHSDWFTDCPGTAVDCRRACIASRIWVTCSACRFFLSPRSPVGTAG